MMDKEKEIHVSDQEIARLFRVYTTVHQMVLDRVSVYFYFYY